MDPTPTISNEQLMAYADGELAPAERAAVDAALAADPALAARLAQHRALRAQLQQAFDTELDEPVPERLQQALRPATPRIAPVISLAERRAAAEAAAAPRAARGGWAWWGGLAASVALGVLVGRLALPGGDGAAPGFALSEGRLVARSGVQTALDTLTAGTPQPGAAVAVPLSFVDQRGRYCRSFTTAASAGLACRDGADWVVQMLVEAAPPAAGEGSRQAASALPPALLAEIDRRIEGPALDAAGEQRALARGWR